MKDSEWMRIEEWGVIGEDRLSGTLFNRPGHRDGGSIVTSPVLEIRIMGSGTWPGSYPVALTQSGSAYRLGKPASNVAIEAAQEFVYSKLPGRWPARTAKREDAFDPARTIIRAAVDTTLHHFERIELDHTTFDPAWIR